MRPPHLGSSFFVQPLLDKFNGVPIHGIIGLKKMLFFYDFPFSSFVVDAKLMPIR